MAIILGLAGYAGAGKDTVADILVRKYGFHRVAFADSLKAIAKRLHYWSGEKDDLGRRHLQTLGQTLREELREDIWILTAFKNADWTKNLVFTDVRYENELNAIRANNGLIYRVIRSGPANDHVSEMLPNYHEKYDGYFINDGTIQDLEDLVIKYMNGFPTV